ncbi:hypothetical protein ACIBXA_13595 [Micromonospora echinaurantiaca]|uniref:hypothetical protein n=1 Tax=Micromonospora TaxID=1873 RepID=UPI000D6ED485|nr:hypothetical protein [Micromonospora sp. S4605]PWU57045.1 hypothetical protein DLJ47_03960 [Micromonospora sp. S4605]
MTIPMDAVALDGSWISPSQTVAYLQRQGWTVRGGRDGLYLRLVPPTVGRSVVVPLDARHADFRDLLSDAVATVGDIAGLDYQRMLTRLDVGIGDLVRFRKEMPTPHGTIPWSSGQSLIASSTRLLEAAAKAQREKVQYFGNKHWTSAKAYMNSVRMGQTEVGSYIVTALTPVGDIAGVDVPLPGFGEALTGREVTRTLVSSLEATRDATDYFNRTSSSAAFDEAVQYGVSYELTQALAQLVANSDGADVGVEWRDWREDAPAPTYVQFEPSDVAALESASNRFARTEPPADVTALGTVTLLDRPRPGTAGVIRLNVIEGSQAKKIRVRLPEELYDQAIQAFREGLAMRLSGRQEKEGRLYWLYDPRGIDLVEVPAAIAPEPAERDNDDELDQPLF